MISEFLHNGNRVIVFGQLFELGEIILILESDRFSVCARFLIFSERTHTLVMEKKAQFVSNSDGPWQVFQPTSGYDPKVFHLRSLILVFIVPL